jgi:hypothetical protein
MLGLWVKLSLGAGRSRFARSGLTSIAWLFAPLLLAACQMPQAPLKSANGAAPAAVQSTAAAQPARAPKATPLAATPAVAHDDAILPTAARLTGDPKELLGLDHSALRRAFGKPAQMRDELTAQVWQYVTGDCVVDLYLYEAEGGLKVTYVEARSRTAEPTPTARCLKSLLERPTASAQ